MRYILESMRDETCENTLARVLRSPFRLDWNGAGFTSLCFTPFHHETFGTSRFYKFLMIAAYVWFVIAPVVPLQLKPARCVLCQRIWFGAQRFHLSTSHDRRTRAWYMMMRLPRLAIFTLIARTTQRVFFCLLHPDSVTTGICVITRLTLYCISIHALARHRERPWAFCNDPSPTQATVDVFCFFLHPLRRSLHEWTGM